MVGAESRGALPWRALLCAAIIGEVRFPGRGQILGFAQAFPLGMLPQYQQPMGSRACCGAFEENFRPQPFGALQLTDSASPSKLKAAASEDHVQEVFSLIDQDGSGRIEENELSEVLRMLDITASEDDVSALFKHLDVNDDKEIEFDEFLSWYSSAASSAQEETNVVMEALLNRPTVNNFDPSEIPSEVLRTAVEAAIAAPCHKVTEPWRFIQLGKETVSKVAELNAAAIAERDPEKAKRKKERWERIPGWCVVTSKKSDGGLQEQEDYAATCCAIQNFMLAMYAEGVGTKWTTGPITRTQVFADLCGVDLVKEQVVGCIWYGFASGGLASVKRPPRKLTVDDVLSSRP